LIFLFGANNMKTLAKQSATMRAIVARKFDSNFQGLSIENQPQPIPQAGELLIRVSCAPVNPADQMMIAGTYIRNTVPPFVPGLVGVGTAIASGGGVMASFIKGKRVVFAATRDKSGTWAEYALAPAGLCVPLPWGMSDEEGVNLLANGATAIALCYELKQGQHHAAIITGAAGELAQLVQAKFSASGGKLIAVVRGQHQVDQLSEGLWAAIIDSQNPNFVEQVKAAAQRFGATSAIDAVAGSMTNQLMDALPDRATIWIIGRISGEDCSFDPMRQLIGRGIQLRGFAIDDWFAARPMLSQLSAVRAATALMQAHPVTPPRACLSLNDAINSLPKLAGAGGRGKVLICPGQSDAIRS
jgi:NADPH:quinone reductase